MKTQPRPIAEASQGKAKIGKIGEMRTEGKYERMNERAREDTRLREVLWKILHSFHSLTHIDCADTAATKAFGRHVVDGEHLLREREREREKGREGEGGREVKKKKKK